MNEQPRMGVAVVIRQDTQWLLQLRPNPPEQDHWQCAGGFLHNHESIFDAALRCIAETGIRTKNMTAGPWTSNVFQDGTRTVTLYVLAEYAGGHAHAGWQWFEEKSLPQPLFLPLRLLTERGVVFPAQV